MNTPLVCAAMTVQEGLVALLQSAVQNAFQAHSRNLEHVAGMFGQKQETNMPAGDHVEKHFSSDIM